VLQSIILDEFNISFLGNVQQKTLLRFIARLHCTWWLPYRSLVRRLNEIGAITSEQYAALYSVDERNFQGEFGKIGIAVSKEIFFKLNQPTNNIGTSPNKIELIIRNFEDGLIDENKFSETLRLFNRTPDEFGYGTNVSQEDLDELDDYFGSENDDEN